MGINNPNALPRRGSQAGLRYNGCMFVQALRRLRSKALLPALLVIFPAILFYAILFREAVNIPYQDDYDDLLDFLNRIAELKGFTAKTSYFLAAQSNEYKLFFAHGLAWLQLELFGHVDIRVLCALGNGFILLLGLLLWKMFLPDRKDLTSRLAFFIPVSWLLFQLEYAGTLDWAMPSLQNLPVVFFSLGAIYFLVRPTRWAFFGALVFLILAIASSGNGFLVIPIGVLILALAHQYARIASWLMVSAGCIAAYAYQYNVMSSQSRPDHSVFSTIIRTRPHYALAFIGSAGGFVPAAPILHAKVFFCFFLGLVLCLFFVYLAWRGYIRRNPLVAYCALFLLLTAAAVAGLRSDFGIGQSLSSRYRIYSALFLIFAWFAIVEEFLQHRTAPLERNRILLGAIAAAVLFSLGVDAWGWRYLRARDRPIVLGMAAYEHPASPESSSGPVLPVPGQPKILDELDRRAPVLLGESIKLGIYRPPQYR